MSIRNEDRHGLGNLKHDPVKILDRLHIPPYIVYFFALSIFGGIVSSNANNEDANIENLQRKNLLLSMRKTQQKLEYGEEEITPAEQLTMATTQYKELAKQAVRDDKALSKIKKTVLESKANSY